MIIGDTFRTIQWYVAAAGFVGLFIFVFYASRNAKITAKYSAWISLFVIALGSILTFNRMNGRTTTTTQAERPTRPQNLTVSQTDSSTIEIRWETEKEDLQFVMYKSGREWQFAYPAVIEATKIHSIIIRNLITNVRYTYQIKSSRATYTSHEGKPLEFMVQ